MRDRVGTEWRHYELTAIPVKVVVEHHYGAFAEYSFQHPVRFAAVVDGGIAGKQFFDIGGIA